MGDSGILIKPKEIYMDLSDLILADRLAVANTLMANERTLLSFFRTSVFFLASGISIIEINFFKEIPYLGWGFVILSPILFLFGLYRFYAVKKYLKKVISEYEK